VERLRAATNLERYGAENAYAAELCKEKIKTAMLERYGVERALQSFTLLRKQQETYVERYGENPGSSDVIQKRIKKTMLERYGVERSMQMLHVREAMMSGSIAKYGVPYPTQNPTVMNDMLDKRYATIQAKGGKAYQSKPEQAFRVLLEDHFGSDDVLVQQRLARKWSIDFYVKSIDTYVQFDGVYWHGLDRPIEEIKASSSERDKTICEKWIKDRELDVYVNVQHLRLVHVTDREFDEDPMACLLRINHGTSIRRST